MPTDFLALPRELRQDILYISFEDAIEQDIGFITSLIMLETLTSQLEVILAIEHHHFCPLIHSNLKNQSNADDIAWFIDNQPEMIKIPCAFYSYTWTKTLSSIGEVVATNDLPYVFNRRLKQLEGLGIPMASNEFYNDRKERWETLLWPARWVDDIQCLRDEHFYFKNGQWEQTNASDDEK
jgi:hypothetical protein